MKYTPHPYQQKAINYLNTHPIAALFLEMGLGKTIITLTHLAQLHATKPDTKTLIIAPLRVAKTTWPQEIKKWDHTQHLTHQTCVGTPKQRLNALAAKAPITIINIENLVWLIKKSGYKWDFNTVIIDELSKFKSHKTAWGKALYTVRSKITHIIGLTGTPSPNGYEDLFAQYRILDGGQRLGKHITHYRNQYFTPDKRSRYQVFSWKLRKGADKQIQEAIQDITMSMSAIDHLPMPTLLPVNKKITLTKESEETYKSLEKEMITSLGEETIVAENAGVLCGKLVQLASGAIYVDETKKYVEFTDAKIRALQELANAANNEPILVAYWFQHEKTRILEAIPQARTLDDEDDFEDWNQGRIPIALIHPASAGHGLNLQAGGHILVWFTMPWSLELYQQANARLYRQGQRASTVLIIHLITQGTIDENISNSLAGKDLTQAQLVEAVKAKYEKLAAA